MNTAERITKARSKAARHGKIAEKNRDQAALRRRIGDRAGAEQFARLAIRAERLQAKALDEAERLHREQSKRRTERQAVERARPGLQAYATRLEAKAAAQKPNEPKQPVTEEERKRLDKQERRRLQAEEKQRKDLAAAGVDADPRTAHGRRQYDVVGMGHKFRASINHLNNTLHKRADRTDKRILAWSKFDEHMQRVHAGELPAARFEAGVDVSTTPGVADSRLDALRLDRSIRDYLGRDLHALMVEVIFHQRSFLEIAPTRAEREGLGFMFRRGLDQLAAYWMIGEDNDRGRRMGRAHSSAAPAAE